MRIYLLLMFLLLQTVVFSQVQSPQVVKASIDSLGVKYPQERVYIQFDKPAYSAGQTIWFKVYLMNGFDPSNLSKTLYVDFTDEEGAVLMHGMYPIWDASAAGSFDVGGNYNGKSIHARAYTSWMLNFDTAFVYNKDIRIIGTNNPPSVKNVTNPTQAASVQFFPEGGDCVEGLKCKVAFKAIYNNGMPATISGIVTDSQGSLVDSLKSLHDGMGFFYLNAVQGNTYTAKWVDENGAMYQTPLPIAKPVGATIEVDLKKSAAWFVVKRSDDAPEEMKQMHVVATMQRQVVYMAPVNLAASPINSGIIPCKQFLSGIMQVTLFDAHWQPVAERILFVNNDDYHFLPSISLDTVGVTKRGKNVLSINVPDSIESNLSISVTDAGLGVDSSDDIVSRLLLTGELKGRVYHPGFYFSNNSDSVARQLDLVMLTNGWRRYKWNDVVKGVAPYIKYPSDTAWLNFSGQLYGATPKQIKNISSVLAIVSQKGNDSVRQYFTLPLSGTGSFSKPGFVFFDTLKVYYQLLSKSGSEVTSSAEVKFNDGGISPLANIQLNKNNFAYKNVDTTGNYRAGTLATEEARLQELLKNTTLKGVSVKTRVKSKMQLMDEKYAGGMFGGGDAKQFDVLNDPLAASSADVYNYLAGRVAGLIITKFDLGRVSVTFRGSPVGMYVDEVLWDPNAVSTLNVNNIAYIKVLRPPFFGGSGGSGQGGAIAIYTRRGGEESNYPGSNGLQYKLVAGYTNAKEFYSPDYSDTNQPNAQEDARSTLYWNPLIITTPKNHVVKLSFYNSDVTQKFRVVLEGVSADGKLARIEKLVQ